MKKPCSYPKKHFTSLFSACLVLTAAFLDAKTPLKPANPDMACSTNSPYSTGQAASVGNNNWMDTNIASGAWAAGCPSNALANPGFETGDLSGWTISPGTPADEAYLNSIAPGPFANVEGAYYGIVASYDNGVVNNMYQDIPTSAGTTANLSVYAAVHNPTNDSNIKLQFLDASNAVLWEQVQQVDHDVDIDLSFQLYTFSGIAPANTVKTRVLAATSALTYTGGTSFKTDAWCLTLMPCITVVSAVPTACNPSTNKYDLAVTVAYDNLQTGDVKISVGDFGTFFFFTPDGTSPDTYTITNLTASGVQDLDVKANFVGNAGCAHTLVDAFDAPASCGNFCPGNLVQNPSFEIASGGGAHPDNAFYTPASWTTNANTAYGETNWLLPDGTGFLFLAGTSNTTASQNIPVSVGFAYDLTFYSAMHFPLINNATATIQYYDASNAPMGSPAVHKVTHDWEDDQTLGGPYTLNLNAAPAGTSYLRITLKNNAGAYVGESVKFDAFCLTAAPCEMSLTTSVSGCFDSNGNTPGGTSVATVQAIVDWQNAPSGETINVTCTGAASQSINPATASKPAVLNFQVPANGSPVAIVASFSTTTACTATQNETAPAGTCLLTPCQSGNTGGTVWRDFNSDGAKDAGETQGLAGVTVTAFDCNGTAIATTTTDYLGQYTFTTLTFPNTYRFEFSNLPTGYKPTSNGTDGRTDVQFISAADCAVDFGANNPADYCQVSPKMVISCYTNGGINTTYPDASLVGYSYYDSGNSAANKSTISTKNQLGSVWGLAYSRTRKKLYSSTFLKRHVALNEPNGLGAIYVTDPNLGSPNGSLFVNIPNTGSVATNATRGLDPAIAPTTQNMDATTFGQLATVGLGDMDISEDDNRLYVVNLFDKKLYVVDIASQSVTNSISIPDPNCVNGTYRPFGLGVRNGKVYVGVICDGSNEAITVSGGMTNWPRQNLHAFVYVMDETTQSFSGTPVLDFPLDYLRGPAFDAPNNSTGIRTGDAGDDGRPHSRRWYGWLNVFDEFALNGFTDPDPNAVVKSFAHPTPILSDIDFDINGDMLLGLTDRTAHQIGYYNYRPNSTSYPWETSFSGGDILRASVSNPSLWNIEPLNYNTADASISNNELEFYKGEWFPAAGHHETSQGGLILLPGKGEVVSTAFDPTGLYTGGLIKLNNTTGLQTSSFEIYDASNAFFGKGNGLGDPAALCNAAPLQIGNYVWLDTDKDGVQDACETPLSGVKVALYKDVSGTLTYVANTTTSANGEYYFTGIGTAGENWASTSGTDSLLPNMNYKIVFGWDGTTAQFAGGNLTISGTAYDLTDADSGEGTNPDLNDSDASLMTVAGNSYPSISLTTGDAGSVNHTYDAGFKPGCVEPSAITLTRTAPTCATGVAQNDGKITLTAVAGADKFGISTGATYSGTPNYAAATAISLPQILQDNIPNTGGTYTIRFFNGNDNCFKDTTVIVLPKTCIVDCCVGTNIISNGSAESGNYTANSSVVDSNNANTNPVYNTDITDWERNANTFWVTDAARATDGSRFVYLPTQNQCFTRLFDLGTDVSSCKTYKICLDIAAFDANTPGGGPATSGFVLEGTYYNSNFSGNEDVFKITNFTDVGTNAPLANPMTISSWNNIQWKRVTATFTLPAATLAGASYFKLYLSNALNLYVPSDGKGILIDNICFTDVSGPATSFSLSQTTPTCTAGTSNNDGKITLTAVAGADKFGVSTGATYSGTPNYAAATAIGTLPQDLQTAIPNAGGTYTIRFFNGSDICFKDTTVVVAAVCCPTTSTVASSHCAGDGFSVTVGTTVFNEINPSGNVLLTSAAGCDSTVTVNLTFKPTSASTVASSHCAGDGFSVTVGTTVFNQANPSGNVVLTNAAGCDSTVTVNLTFVPAANAGIATNPAPICLAATGLAFIDLFAQLAGEQTGGVWTKTSGPATGINFDANAGRLDPNGLPAGTYVFQYTVTGTSPCPNDSEVVSVTISNCVLPCPPKVCLPVKVVKVAGSN